MLTVDPCHADSLHFLGGIACQTGRHDLAVALIGKAIAIAPQTALYHANLGNVLQAAGRLDEAIVCYRRVVDLAPEFPGACHRLGSALGQQGRPEAAAAWFRRALDFAPDDADAHIGLAAALHAQGRLDAAAACYHRALALRPDTRDAHNNLGTVLYRQGSLADAAACYRRALELDPAFEEALLNLAAVQGDLDRPDCAIACYRRALDLNPDRPMTHHDLGAAYMRLEQPAEAIACLQTALRLMPDFPEAYNNLGVTQMRLGQPARAILSFRAAIRQSPAFAAAHNNLAMALLATGDMAAGWLEYEWRWEVATQREPHRAFAQPQWRGEAAAGLTLLVHTEQGFGDTLQFCRYAPMLRRHGLRVIIEAPAPLLRVLRGLDGVDAVVECGEALPPFDLHCPMLSLPLALGTTLATIPASVPYLRADASEAAAWRARLAAVAQAGPRVGLVWAGNPHSTWRDGVALDRRRSIAPEQLAPLFDVPGVQWFSLQKANAPAPARFGLIDDMDAIDDFAGTAALIANLDLVISVDTAVVHLAGALGKPVWLLDRFDHCWRWLAGRRDSPWYPTMRIYRQPRQGDWEAVVAEVAGDLRQFVAAHPPAVREPRAPPQPPRETAGRQRRPAARATVHTGGKR